MSGSLDSTESTLWLVSWLSWGVGDLGTTLLGLSLGAVELSPVGASIIASSGLSALVSIKLVSLSLFGVVYGAVRLLDRRAALGVPIGLSLLGTIVVSINTAVVLVLLVGGVGA